MPGVARRPVGRRPDLRHHHRRLRRLRAALRLRLPVRQVRPGLRAGVQQRRDGEHRLRRDPRRVRVPRSGDRGFVPGPRRHDPARAVAHVVRRPRHHDLVGRPVAQGVLRDLGLALRQRRARRPRRQLGQLLQRDEDLGLSPRPAPVDPPDRRRHGRPGGGGAELRRHHVRKGRVGARPARRVRRPRRVPGGRTRLLQQARLRQHTPERPAGRLGARLGTGSLVLVCPVARDGRGEHDHPGVQLSTPTVGSPRSRCGRARPTATRPCATIVSRSACTRSPRTG